MSKSRYVSMKDDLFKAVIGFILILLFIFAISSFFVNDGNNSNSNTGGNEDNNRNLITFTIGDDTLQAEKGMTWSQWLIDHKDNIGFDQNGEYITITTGAHILYLCMEDGTLVKPSDVILEGGVYYFSTLRPDPDTGEDDNPDLITFTVGQTTLQAESGMTWEEWLNSTYNYGDFNINYNYICIGSYSEYAVFTSEGKVVLKNDKIIDGAKYYCSQTPSNSPLEFGKGYIISAYNKSGLIYVVETTTSGRFNTTQDASEAAVFYIQYAPGSNELLLYYLDYGIKNYVIMNNKADGAAFTVDVSKATSFVWNDTLNTMVVADPENNRAFGAEISSNSFYISTFVVTTVTKNWGQFIPVDSIENPDIGGDGEGDNSNKIFFYIGATKYFAENGMTWSEWIDSDYDSGPYVLSDDNISSGGRHGGLVYTSDGNIVLKDDLIVDGAIHRLIIPDKVDPTPDPDTGGDGEDDNPVLITFTVGRTNLLAESGMTWSQWLVDPKYNTDDFVKNGEYISIGAENFCLCMKDGTRVKLSDTILEGGVYYFLILQCIIKQLL